MTTVEANALTYLYVPGDRPERFDKAVASGARAIVIDLEDAVPLRAKKQARDAATAWLAGRDRSGPAVWVRVNSGPGLAADVEAVVAAEPTGIWLPKCESAHDLFRLDELITEGGGSNDVAVSPLIETATGLWNVREICGAPRVTFAQLGEVDLAADLGVRPGPDGAELLWARSRLVAASVAVGIEPPLGPVSPEIRDVESFMQDTERIARLGFVGRACIHPAQLSAVSAVFTPSDDEVTAAIEVLELFDRANGAAVVDAAGRLVDEAVARNARRVLRRR